MSKIYSIFVLGKCEHCQLTTQIDGIDRTFPFGNGAAPVLTPGCTSFPSQLGTPQVSTGLAQLYTNYFILYLGVGTRPTARGTSPVTLTPGGVGVKMSIYIKT